MCPGVGSNKPPACPKCGMALATPVVLWGGWPFFLPGWRSIATWNLNMFTLIAIGTGAAWLFSTVALLAPGIFPDGFRGTGGRTGLYFESAAVIIVLVLLGQVLEPRARERTCDAFRALPDLAPKTARRVTDSDERDAPLDAVVAGDRLRVRPGEAAPVAASLLFPFFGLLLSRVMAAAAMSLSSICVIGNALRLKQVRLEDRP